MRARLHWKMAWWHRLCDFQHRMRRKSEVKLMAWIVYLSLVCAHTFEFGRDLECRMSNCVKPVRLRTSMTNSTAEQANKLLSIIVICLKLVRTQFDTYVRRSSTRWQRRHIRYLRCCDVGAACSHSHITCSGHSMLPASLELLVDWCCWPAAVCYANNKLFNFIKRKWSPSAPISVVLR